jgi:hypothetical protein
MAIAVAPETRADNCIRLVTTVTYNRYKFVTVSLPEWPRVTAQLVVAAVARAL